MTVYFVFMLAGLLMVAAVSKLTAANEFMKTLYNVGVPRRLIPSFAWAIPIAEATGGMLLLIPATQTIGCGIAIVLIASFVAVNISAIVRNKKVECNCFGRMMPNKLGWAGLARVLLLLAIAAFVLAKPDIAVYEQPLEILFYQATASIGILLFTALVAQLIQDRLSGKESEVGG